MLGGDRYLKGAVRRIVLGLQLPLLKRKRHIGLRVEDLMTAPPITINRDEPIEKAAQLMYENRIGSVLVVDEDGKLVGIVTERDMIYAIVGGKVGKKLPVWEIMTENPITTTPDELLVDAIEKMKDAKIRHLPVVDEKGKPVGMLSMRDVLDYLLTILHIAVKE